jgi:drug/metabolite transporter (DMT)-like permease
MSRRSWTLLLALSAIWGASYMLIKIGIRDLSPAMVAWSRIALAAALLAGYAWGRGSLRGFGGQAGWLAVLASVQVAGPFLLISAGEQEISSSLAGILVASTPLFTALLAIRVDQEERSRGPRLVGVVLGIVGVAVLLGVDLGGDGRQLLGGLAVVLASLGYAIGSFMVKHRVVEGPQIGIAAWVMIASTALLAPAAAVGFPQSAPGLGPVVSVALLGVLGTGVAFLILYHLIDTVGPARTWIVTYLAPGFAVVYGALLLDESISVATVAGLVLILLGSWLAAGGRPRRVGKREETVGSPRTSRSDAPRARVHDHRSDRCAND